MVSLSCSSHTRVVCRLPKEARFPSPWGRCLNGQRRTRGQGWGYRTIQKKGMRTTINRPQSSKKPAGGLQKLKHKSTVTLDLMLSNRESNSELKRKTVKLNSHTCQAPACSEHPEPQRQLDGAVLMSTEALGLWLSQ